MIGGKVRKDIINNIPVRIVCIVAALVIAMILGPLGKIIAASGAGSTSTGALRETHKVKVGDDKYCFFVQNNVVLTPADIAAAESDEELAWEIMEKAGLYIKATNCTKASHKSISVSKWTKSYGNLLLSPDDITSLRNAAPTDGAPVKLHMDVRVSTRLPSDDEEEAGDEPTTDDEMGTDGSDDQTTTDDQTGSGDENSNVDGTNNDDQTDSDDESTSEEEVYSTFKLTGEELLFIVVATEDDAKVAEDYCKDKSNNGNNNDTPDVPDIPDDDDMLPELRTIPMPDRSGPPIESTLKDGDPVTLEWIEPNKRKNESSESEEQSYLPYVAAALAVAAAAGVIAALAIRRRRKEEDR